MMSDVTVNYVLDGEPADPEVLQDEDFELAETLLSTGEHLRGDIARKLDGMRCPDHGGVPHVLVTAAYDRETGQMEASYHIDACCQKLLMMAVSSLNH
jgi:hypothetical protein